MSFKFQGSVMIYVYFMHSPALKQEETRTATLADELVKTIKKLMLCYFGKLHNYCRYNIMGIHLVTIKKLDTQGGIAASKVIP